MIVDINKSLEDFNLRYNKKINEKIKIEILKYIEIKKNNEVFSIDYLAFEFVRLQRDFSFELLLQIKSSLAFLKEKLISSLLNKQKVMIGNDILALEKKGNTKLSLVVNSTNSGNLENLFLESDTRSSLDLLKFLNTKITEHINSGNIVDVFGLFLIYKKYVINSLTALEEFNNYD